MRLNSTFLSTALIVSMTASCAVQTEPTTLAQRSARAGVDRADLFRGQEEITKPVTLYEAIARAVKYNSSQRVAMMEQAMENGVSSMDLLPKIAANGGFSTRSKRLAVSAEPVADGGTGLDESYIEDKTVRGASLQTAFNVLDFGISYVNAKQASDRRYIAEEIRRKSVQQIVRDVRAAFWKAAAAQRVVADMAVLIGATQDELVRVNSRDVANKTVEQLKEQKRLLTALKTLTDMRDDILTAKAELAALMNLPPTADFVLDVPPEVDRPRIVHDLGQINLEQFALVNRPELRVNDYEARIAAAEARKEFLRLFPGIEFNAGVNYNSNSALRNKNWADAGIGVTWNLLDLFARPAAIRRARDKQELERLRRLAMTMAVMTQVNVSYLELRQSAEAFEVARSMQKVDDGLWARAYDADAKNDRDRRETLFAAVDKLASHLKRDFAYADYKSAESNLFMALGVDPLPRFTVRAGVDAIAQTLEDNLSRNAPRGFKDVSYDHPNSEKSVQAVFSTEERAALMSGVKARKDRTPRPSAVKDPNAPLILAGAAVADKKPAAPKPIVPSALPENFRLLQLSSFERLDNAQSYWRELTAADAGLKAYSPIFREVKVGKTTRFRTFVADTEKRLKDVCARLNAELKACLISKR